ncbi:MAG: archease [Candidatus Thermoplasmatota archaeon]|nr:archease [Candidatus Thermoplasmatota archaeon]
MRIYGEDSATILYNSIYAIGSLIHRPGLTVNAKYLEPLNTDITPYFIVDIMNFVISEFEVNRILYFGCELKDSGIILKGHRFLRNIKPINSIKAATYHNLPENITAGYLDVTLDI